MKKILVTGGAGYIGSMICKELSKIGITPVTLDNLDTGHKWAVKWGPFFYGDVRNSESLVTVLSNHEIETVYHLAGFSSVRESFLNPYECHSVNITGTLQILEFMRLKKIKKIVFASSCSVYGNVGNSKIGENQLHRPINPYGYSKSVAEKIIHDYCNAHGINAISLRFFNAAGADSELDVGEHKEIHTHLIPILFDCVSGVADTFSIFGNNYPTPDGTCVRDYIHVLDLAQAFILSDAFLNTTNGNYSFNLGSGMGYSVLEIVKLVEKVVKKKINYLCGAPRLGDPPYLVADIQNAREKLQWSPCIGELEEIITSAWHWYKKVSAIEKKM